MVQYEILQYAVKCEGRMQMSLLKSLVIAVSMYSKVPMPRVEWNEKNMRYVMCFFPLVGALIGICVYAAAWLLTDSSCGTLLFSAVLTVIPIAVSGGIHMDGFLDTVDALCSYGDPEKKLAILKDPHAGAFAILGMGCYLLLNVALWSEWNMCPDRRFLAVVCCGYVFSRSLSGLSVVTFPAAKDSGLARTFQDGAKKGRTKIVMIVWLIVTGILMLWFSPAAGIAAMVCAGIVFFLYRRMCRRQFGGITGDLAGYFLQMCELAILAGVFLVWKCI